VIPTPGRPVVSESWGGTYRPHVVYELVLTSGEVADVSVDGGASIPTRSEPGLPYGLRAVLLEAEGVSLPEFLRQHRPKVTPIDSAGHVLSQPSGRFLPRGYELESASWQRPARPTHGACQLSGAVPGLVPELGNSVAHIRPFRGVIGRPFLSCGDTQYSVDNWPLDAGVVLDATRPGGEPASLPLMKSVPGYPGYWQAPGVNGTVLGRRIHGAWLLVDGGSGFGQRLAVLSHLKAAIRF
jgi:hypothetical protein